MFSISLKKYVTMSSPSSEFNGYYGRVSTYILSGACKGRFSNHVQLFATQGQAKDFVCNVLAGSGEFYFLTREEASNIFNEIQNLRMRPPFGDTYSFKNERIHTECSVFPSEFSGVNHYPDWRKFLEEMKPTPKKVVLTKKIESLPKKAIFQDSSDDDSDCEEKKTETPPKKVVPQKKKNDFSDDDSDFDIGITPANVEEEKYITIQCWTSKNGNMPCFEFYTEAKNVDNLKREICEFLLKNYISRGKKICLDWADLRSQYSKRFPTHTYITEYDSKKSKTSLSISINYHTEEISFEGYRLSTYKKLLECKKEDKFPDKDADMWYDNNDSDDECEWYGETILHPNSAENTANQISYLLHCYGNPFSEQEKRRLSILTYFAHSRQIRRVGDIFTNEKVKDEFKDDMETLDKFNDFVDDRIVETRKYAG